MTCKFSRRATRVSVRGTSHGALFVIALRRWSCSCSSRCACVSVSTNVSSVVRIVYFTTYKFWKVRSVEVISVAAQMRARGSPVLRALPLDIERASCPIPVHADVFVLTSFFVVFGRFIRAFVSFVLETAWLCSQPVVVCRLRVNSCQRESHGEFSCHMHHSHLCCERSVHHQSHDAVDNELCIGAVVVHSAPHVVCSREQSLIPGCRRFVGFVSE